MRAQAKRSSAANRDGSATRGSAAGSRNAAIRASSPNFDGSGAPSPRRARLAVLSLAALAFASLALAASALASKEVSKYFGTQASDNFGRGTFGGEFSTPSDIGVNTSGVGVPVGTIYVADDANHRIQRFDRNNRFVSAWGKDVIAPTVNERQRLVIDDAAGTYQLTFNGVTSAPIAFNASSLTVDSALGALSSVGGGANVAVSGAGTFINPFIVTFQGTLAATDFAQMVVDTSQLEGTVRITTLADGDATTSSTGTAFEVCTVAGECKAGVASGGDGTTAGNGSLSAPQAVAIDNDTGNVYVSDRDNRRVSVYDTSGNFIASYGWSVVNTGSNNAAEFQRVTVDATGGTFTLSFGANAPTTTDPLDFNASAATIQSRLEALGDIGAGNVLVSGPTGGPWTVRFVGTLSNRNVALLGTDATLLTGDNPNVAGAGPTATATEVVAGAQASNYEICPASNVCQAGASGSGAGQYGAGSTFGTFGIAVSPPDSNAATGTIYLANSSATAAQRRVNTYSLDGTSFSSFGSSANFGTTQPRRVAVDSKGIVYASDSNNGAELDRFDTQNVHGGGFNSLLASIPASVDEVQRLNFPGIHLFSDFSYRLTCPNGVQTDVIIYRFGEDALRSALEAACGAGTVAVSSSVGFTNVQVRFQGALGGRDLVEMTCTTVVGSTPCSATTLTEGRTAALLTGTNSGGSDAGGTRGLAVDPDLDGGGGDEDVLYVLRAGAGFAAVQQFGPVNDPGLTAAPTTADDVHGAGAGFTDNVSGLGLDDRSGRLFVSDTSGGGGVPAPGGGVAGAAHRVYILDDPLPDPAMALNPVTVKTDTTATFSAGVDPRGGLIRCAFQYSTDPGFASTTDVAAPGCDSLGPDAGFQAFSQRAGGLTPATRYFIRLKVTRTFDAGAIATSSPTDFFTDSVPPALSDVGAIQVQDTSARMVGTIDPKNSATGYVFEYGTTPALGSSTRPLNIGGGTTPITVSQVVGGLSPDTDYWFRLVATNEFGTTNGATKTFHTRAEPLPLPADRAYEQVSPPDKNLGSADFGGGSISYDVSPSGNSVAFCTSSLFGEPPGQMLFACAPYVSERGPGGWSTTNPFPLACGHDLDGSSGQRLVNYPFISADHSHVALEQPESESCAFDPLSPVATLPNRNLYSMDLTAEPPSFELLTPNRLWDVGDVPLADGSRAIPLGGTPDFSHIVYQTRLNQTDPPDSPPAGRFNKLYEWTRQGEDGCTVPGGCLTMVGKDTSGVPFTTPSGYPKTFQGETFAYSVPNRAVSSDGERIFFQNPVPDGGEPGPVICQVVSPCDLYMREDATVTHKVSASECTTSCGPPVAAVDLFKWASSRGTEAIFSSCDKLTDASAPPVACGHGGGADVDLPADGIKLYRWADSPNPEVDQNLIDLAVDEEPADGSQPNVKGLIGASDDGSAAPESNAAPGNTVYFVAGGQLVPGAPTATVGPKIYRWRWNGGNPSLDYLGAFSLKRFYGTREEAGKAVSLTMDFVTPDGRYLLVETRARLNPVADTDADNDVYRWDEEGGWRCASCQLPGVASGGESGIIDVYQGPLASPTVATALAGSSRKLAMSDDGRVFFDSPDALVPQDTNDEAGCVEVNDNGNFKYSCDDVYEWNDGTLSLVSSGMSDERSYLLGTTPSGDDVFFYTRERLVGWDTDNGIDIYNARVGGGFPEPPPVPPECDLEAGACEGPGTVAAATTGAGTAAFQGPENPRPTPSRVCPRGKRRVVRNGRTHCVAKKRKRQNRAAKHNRRATR